jgi:peptidoglycan/LPS O-acetylase OafA/YrhL
MIDSHRHAAEGDTRSPYLPVLDGLRAIAVLSVFIFHLEPAMLPGGFVGVDIFFVLSGFLITRIIHRDLTTGQFSLSRFYQRRIARIAPPLFLMCAAVLVVAGCVYTEKDLAETGSSVAAAVASILNIKLIFKENYFELAADTFPVLHCWSLSVEEQFYLCYPVFLRACHRIRVRLFPAVATLTALSLVACIVITPYRPNWAFYLPLTRAWELGAGALVALWGGEVTPRCRSVSAWGGLAVLAASILATPGGEAFPGAWAVLPVAGALLVIVAQEPGTKGRAPDPPMRALASPPVVGIGRMSYSLYLWHWPVFTFIDYMLVLASPWLRVLAKVVVTLLCTWVSYVFVEVPLRGRLGRPSARRLAYAAFSVGAIALCALGYGIRLHYNLNGTVASVRRGGARYGDGRPVTVLIGDSTACMFATTVRDICRETRGTMVMAAVPGANPLPLPQEHGETFWSLTEPILARERPACVILSAAWTRVLKTAEDRGRLVRCIETLLTHADRVILLTQPPILPAEATRAGMRRGARPPFHEDRADRQHRLEVNDAVRGLASDRVAVIDLDACLLGATGAIQLWDSRGDDLFVDRWHISSVAARRLAPLLRVAIQRSSTVSLEPVASW